METHDTHIVKSYGEDLEHLNHLIEEMGLLAAQQLGNAMQALAKRDVERARQVVQADKEIDSLESQIDVQVVRVLALRQPLAGDLRRVVAAMKTSGNLERIGDYARNIANRSQILVFAPEHDCGIRIIERMATMVGGMIYDVIRAYRESDFERAEAVRLRDESVDQLNTSLFRELLPCVVDEPRDITPFIHLLFIAKNLERMGDHVTNIAEHVYVMATGETLDSERPKKDQSSLTIA